MNTIKVSGTGDTDARVAALEQAVNYGEVILPFPVVGDGPPSGAAGGDLSGTYPNPQIAAGAIVDADVSATAAIQYSKLTGVPTALPPSGAAGGDLTGTYPNPTIGAGKVTLAKLAIGASIRTQATAACLETNQAGSTAKDFATLTLTVSGGLVVITGELNGSIHDSGSGAHWTQLSLLRSAGILRRWLVPVQHPSTMLTPMFFHVFYHESPAAGSVTYTLQVVSDAAVTIRTDLFAGASRAGYLTAIEFA